MLFIKSLLGLFIRDVIDDSIQRVAKREAVNQLTESVRQEFLKTVAEGYTREVNYNIGQYIRSVQTASVEISSGNTGEKLYTALQKSFKDLESELEKQGPDSPVIQYLQKRYGEQTQSFVGRKVKPVYTMVTGYSPTVQKDSPWLNRVVDTSPEIGDILAEEAKRIFEILFPPPSS